MSGELDNVMGYKKPIRLSIKKRLELLDLNHNGDEE